MRTLTAIALLLSFCSSINAAPPAKNVVLIMSDDLKASVLGCYGDPHCQTPNIDRLADRGMLFEHAYCQGTSCRPSRLSMMYSQYPRKKAKAGANLGEHLIDHAWHTARVGKIYHMRVPGDIIAGTNGDDVSSTWVERYNSQGLEAHTPGDYACLNLNIFTRELEGRQSTKMPHRMFVTVTYQGDGSDQPDHKTAAKTIELLQQRSEQPDKPFFLAVGFVRPHYPMVTPKQYVAPYPWQKMSMPKVIENDLDDIPKLGLAGTRSGVNPIGKYPDNQKRMWSGYYASVAFMDEQVGRILSELDRLGLRDSTAVIFTSDHGYHLGEHTFWQKSNLHEEVLRVPLIISAPGKPAGRSQSFVELVDLYPTVCELGGVASPQGLDGVSLLPILDDPKKSVKAGARSFHRGQSYRNSRWAYMRYSDGSEELYDMRSDPQQFHNLASSSEHAAVKKVMAAKLLAGAK